MRAFRGAHTAASGRVSQGLVVIPTDSAIAEQRAKYEEYAAAAAPPHRDAAGPGAG